jgi:hypothetical protein
VFITQMRMPLLLRPNKKYAPHRLQAKNLPLVVLDVVDNKISIVNNSINILATPGSSDVGSSKDA